MRVGSFATGFEKIKTKFWWCPAHGEVTSGATYYAVRATDGSHCIIHWCGKEVERREHR